MPAGVITLLVYSTQVNAASSVRPRNNGILLLKIVKRLKSFVPLRQFHLNPGRTSLPINFVSVTVHCAASEILKFAHNRQN